MPKKLNIEFNWEVGLKAMMKSSFPFGQRERGIAKGKVCGFLFFILVSVFFTSCAARPIPVSKSGFYFDTVISVTLYQSAQEPLLDECFLLAQKYENLFSKTTAGSDVYRINHSNGAPTTVSADTLRLLEKALAWAERSDGAVDPTIGGVSSLWDFSEENEKLLPDAAQLAEALSHVDYRKISIDHDSQSVTLTDPLAQLDLGFIAKGYIADRIKEFLAANQVEHAIINLGGNVLVIGDKPDGSAYNIGLQKPFAPAGTAALTVQLTDRSAVSSGNYERFFTKDGILYHHILNPSTGYPVDNGLSAVTILSDHSVDGDALSTLVFILGTEKGSQLIETLPNTSAILITKDGEQITVTGPNSPSSTA